MQQAAQHQIIPAAVLVRTAPLRIIELMLLMLIADAQLPLCAPLPLFVPHPVRFVMLLAA